MALPERSRVVVIGGGVIGCSIAYHLARRGWTDVLLIERKSLTHGSTWHAAGLVGQLRGSSNLTQLMQQSVRTYRTLEEETGYPTGWRGVGSLRVASSPDRWLELKRLATTGKSFGFDIRLVSPAEAGELFPLLNTAGVYGATWVPTDGYADPSQLTHSFAAGARAAGVRIVQNCRVEAIERAGRRVTAVRTEQGRVECEFAVNATGMWGTETAKLAGVDVATGVVEHQYVVTEKTADVPRDLPTLRDPDARFYLKPEAGALVIGGWEDGTRAPWPHGIPRDLGPELFPPDVERFAPLAEGATERVPAFGELGIQTWVNGPIPFSPDAEPLMGVTEDLDNLFHCCGFSAGIAAAGGAGWAMANWIVDGDPGMDLWPFDIRRFGAPHSVPAALERRAVAAYEHYYLLHYPNSRPPAVRGQRRSPLYDVLRARGSVNGAKYGWERADWFAPEGVPAVETPTFGRSEAWPHIADEHRAVREAVGVVDQTSFAKFEIEGPGSLELLQRIAGGEMDVRPGRVVYTQLLNARGGIEADVTVTRLAPELFYLVTGSAFGRHDLSFVLRHAPDDGSVRIRDVTSAYGVLNVCGPRSRALVQRLSRADFGNAAFPFMRAREVDLGHAPVRALRVTYVGELGWEFHVPVEYLRGLYEQVLDAGEEFGIRDVGYRAVDSLRLEKQFLAWAADIRSDNDPYEAGLGFAVRPDKPQLLAGPALRKLRDEGTPRRLCWFSTDADVVMHGGELVAHRGTEPAAAVRSAGYGHTVGRTIFNAYLPAELAADTAGTADNTAADSGFEVEVAGERVPATRHTAPLYDPRGANIRC